MSRTGGSRSGDAAGFPVGLAAAALLFLLLRGLILHTAFDRVALWMFELFPMGTMAELALRGIDFPARLVYDNAAGQILAGWLAVPAFRLFGSSYLSLKLVPLALGLGTLGLVWSFLDRSFGRRAANLGALLFAIAPPTLVKYSVICSGNHFENLFFTMLALVCAYRLHASPGSRLWLVASGFSQGLALFVFLGALIPVGILAGMHLGIRGLWRTLRDLAWCLPAFALGIAPLVALNLATGSRGLGFLGAKFAEGEARPGDPVLQRIGEFLGVHLPRAGVFEPVAGLSREALGTLFLAAFAVAYAACLPGALRGIGSLLRGVLRPAEDTFERARLVPLVLVLPLSAVAFGLSNLRIGVYAAPLEVAGYRYFLPTLLFAILAIAVVADRWWERGGSLRATGAAVFGVALLAGASSFAIVDWSFSRTGLGTAYRGYDLSKLARGLLSARNALPHEEVVARIESYPPLVRGRVARAVGFNLGVFGIEDHGLEDAIPAFPAEMLDRYPRDLRGDIACGGGVGVRFMASLADRKGPDLLGPLVAGWEAWPDRSDEGARDLRQVVEGACHRNPELPLADQTARVLDENHALVVLGAAAPIGSTERDVALGIAEGQGRLCGRLLVRGIPSDREAVARAAAGAEETGAETKTAFWRGVGCGLAEEDETPSVPDGLLDLPGFDAGTVGRGLGAALRRIHGEGAGEASGPWIRAFEAETRAEIEDGLRQGLEE